jgi:hypothetical protein
MRLVVGAIIDKACEFIHNNPDVIKEKNTEDFWHYAEEDGIQCEGHECKCTSLNCGPRFLIYRENLDKTLCETCWDEDCWDEAEEEDED